MAFESSWTSYSRGNALLNDHLNIRSLRNKTLRSRLRQLGWTALQAMRKLNFLGLCVLDKTAL